MSDYKEKAFDLIDNGLVSAEDMAIMAIKYMSVDDVEDMLDANELSDRFFEDEEDAAIVFNVASQLMQGEYGYLNLSLIHI